MALTDKQIGSLLDEIVKHLGKGKDQDKEVQKKSLDHLLKWNNILKDNTSMQLLGMTLAATYADMDKHKETHYVIDKTMQVGMLVGYLLREKEQEVEQLEALHGADATRE